MGNNQVSSEQASSGQSKTEGENVEQAAPEQLVQMKTDVPGGSEKTSDMPKNNSEAMEKMKSLAKKANKKVIAIAAAAVIVFVVIIAVFMNVRKTINLNDYVTVEFAGYNTAGTASVTIDEAALGQKIQEVGRNSQMKWRFGRD